MTGMRRHDGRMTNGRACDGRTGLHGTTGRACKGRQDGPPLTERAWDDRKGLRRQDGPLTDLDLSLLRSLVGAEERTALWTCKHRPVDMQA
ncbi:hypothetical protein LSAT2_017504, partial [Lamellibrachia satsuma]